MKKILIVSTAGLAVGGITTNIYNYLYHLDKSQFQFELAVTVIYDKTCVERFRQLGCKIYFLKNRNKKPISYLLQLAKLIHFNKYDLVHIHSSSHTAVLDLIGCVIGGCKNRIVHAHNTRSNSLALHKVLSLPFNMLCKGRLACGKEAGKFMFGNRMFLVVNNGVDVNKLAFSEEVRIKWREKLKIGPNDILIGHVGIFLEVKNQKFIVEILNELTKINANYRLCLVGDGPLRKSVELLVATKLLNDKVIFTGNVTNVNQLLNAFDLIVMPSLYEGLPLALIEQQANGLYCLCSDTITPEVNMSNNIGFLPLTASAKEWAEDIAKLKLSNRLACSQSAIKQIKERGYNIADEASKLGIYYNNFK